MINVLFIDESFDRLTILDISNICLKLVESLFLQYFTLSVTFGDFFLPFTFYLTFLVKKNIILDTLSITRKCRQIKGELRT